MRRVTVGTYKSCIVEKKGDLHSSGAKQKNASLTFRRTFRLDVIRTVVFLFTVLDPKRTRAIYNTDLCLAKLGFSNSCNKCNQDYNYGISLVLELTLIFLLSLYRK